MAAAIPPAVDVNAPVKTPKRPCDFTALIAPFVKDAPKPMIGTFIPALANIFNVTNLTSTQWMITLGISILPIPIMEVQKKMNQMTVKKEKKILIKHTIHEGNKG